MMQHKATIPFGIIGLGRFGFALAKTLSEAGKEVLVIDSNENKIKHIRSYTDNAFIVRQLDRETLEETGLQNCETVIVCIGEKIDTSILTTLHVINMGIPRVVAKAISSEQGSILEKIGAEVVYPENDMAVRLANKLIYPSGLDFIELNEDIAISEIKVTSKLAGQSIVEADLRGKFSLNIIALEKDSKTIVEVMPNYILSENDIIVVIGKRKKIQKLEDYLAKKN